MIINLLTRSLLNIARYPILLRKLILITLDIFSLILSILLTLWFSSKFYLDSYSEFIFFNFVITVFFISTNLFTGTYKGITKYIGSLDFYKSGLRNILLIIFINLFNYLFDINFIKGKSQIIFWLILTGFTVLIRLLIRDVLRKFIFSENISKKINVIIYGAGSAGAQLAASLNLDKKYNILFFVDDDSQLCGRYLYGFSIKKPNKIHEYKSNIDSILLAIPSLSITKRRLILNKLEAHNLPVLQIPSIADLSSGKAKINNLKPISINDLLGRGVVVPDEKLLFKGIHNKNICITGAGGSIGSELCKQVFKYKPKKVILIERNEQSLYLLDQELINFSENKVKFECFLGSATDKLFLKNIFSKQSIDVVFHAAAYKHVPLVENNPLTGIYNNVNSSIAVCEAAEEIGLGHAILISSDKAVRPTNIMGATKRLSELIFQSFAQKVSARLNKNKKETLFTMVRFGNVLASSGSVVPLFKKQIEQGGPITLTHPDVIRYFMTLEEASQLVLHTISLAKGGDVFLLDMGEPIKIIDLAKKMINLSGFSHDNKKNMNATIKIKVTGLRPGEKLYEELLIDSESIKTKHPLIYKAHEKMIKHEELKPIIDKLQKSLVKRDLEKTLQIMNEIVPDWKRFNV